MSETIHLFFLCFVSSSLVEIIRYVYIHMLHARIRQMCKHWLFLPYITTTTTTHIFFTLSSSSVIALSMPLCLVYTHRWMYHVCMIRDDRCSNNRYKKISVHAVHCIGIYTYIFETSQHVRTFKWRQRCDVKYWHSTIDVFVVCCTFRSTCSKHFMVQPL